MRSLVWAALAAAACTPGDRRGADGPATPAQKYAGTWEGRAFHSESDTGTPFRIVSSVAQDGTLRSTLTLLSVTTPEPIPVRARAVSDTTLVDETGPYQSPSTHRLVVTTTTGRLHGDSLNGTFQMRPAEGGATLMSGTFRSKRIAR